jgi:hypothetical protein
MCKSPVINLDTKRLTKYSAWAIFVLFQNGGVVLHTTCNILLHSNELSSVSGTDVSGTEFANRAN